MPLPQLSSKCIHDGLAFLSEAFVLYSSKMPAKTQEKLSFEHDFYEKHHKAFFSKVPSTGTHSIFYGTNLVVCQLPISLRANIDRTAMKQLLGDMGFTGRFEKNGEYLYISLPLFEKQIAKSAGKHTNEFDNNILLLFKAVALAADSSRDFKIRFEEFIAFATAINPIFCSGSHYSTDIGTIASSDTLHFTKPAELQSKPLEIFFSGVRLFVTQITEDDELRELCFDRSQNRFYSETHPQSKSTQLMLHHVKDIYAYFNRTQPVVEEKREEDVEAFSPRFSY